MKLKKRIDNIEKSLRVDSKEVFCIVYKHNNTMNIPSLGFNGPIEEGMKLVDLDSKNTFIINIDIPRPNNVRGENE